MYEHDPITHLNGLGGSGSNSYSVSSHLRDTECNGSIEPDPYSTSINMNRDDYLRECQGRIDSLRDIVRDNEPLPYNLSRDSVDNINFRLDSGMLVEGQHMMPREIAVDLPIIPSADGGPADGDSPGQPRHGGRGLGGAGGPSSSAVVGGGGGDGEEEDAFEANLADRIGAGNLAVRPMGSAGDTKLNPKSPHNALGASNSATPAFRECDEEEQREWKLNDVLVWLFF